MDWLEQELKQALARKDPSPDFADAVVARANLPAPRRRPAPSRWLSTAAAVIVIVGGVEAWRWHRGLEAKRQVMEAMRLTAGTLNHIQSKVREVRP
jgi:hypothetical protein